MLNNAFPPYVGIECRRTIWMHEPHGRSRLFFLEDDPPISVEHGPPTSVEYDASISVMPSDSKRTPSASVLFVFLFLVLAGVGGAFAWRYYHFYNEIERLEKNNARITADGGQATDMIRASDYLAQRASRLPRLQVLQKSSSSLNPSRVVLRKSSSSLNPTRVISPPSGTR